MSNLMESQDWLKIPDEQKCRFEIWAVALTDTATSRRSLTASGGLVWYQPFCCTLRDFLFIYLSFINAEDEMSPLHRIIVMPVGLFLVWPLFYGGGLAASRPHSAVAVWYICQACDLMWRPLGGCFTEPSSILFSPRGLENSSWTSKRNAFQASCLLSLSNRSSFFLFGCFVLSSTRWELLKSKFRPLIKEGKPLSAAL